MINFKSVNPVEGKERDMHLTHFSICCQQANEHSNVIIRETKNLKKIVLENNPNSSIIKEYNTINNNVEENSTIYFFLNHD